MTFGQASFGIQTRKRAHPRLRRFDCGSRGKLTVRQIAALAGVTEKAIWGRIARKVSPENLTAPPYQSVRGEIRTACRSPVVVIACRLAKAFPDRLPTVEEIMRVQPMVRRGALRWRQALDEARRRA